MIVRGPSNIPRPPTFSAMTTRSMARIGTLGTQLMGNDNPPFQMRQMAPPTPIPPRFQPAVLQVTEQRPIGPVANVARQRATTAFDADYPRLLPYQRPLEIPVIPQISSRSGARLPIRSRLGGLFNRVRRNVFANVRYHRLDDNVRLIENPRAPIHPHVPIGRRVVRFKKKHKRKLAIAGGVLAAGGAIIGGLAGGIPRKEEKRELLTYIDHPKINMREGHSGTLARIVKGANAPSYYNFEGGGGGGGGGGGSVYAPTPTSYKRRRKSAAKRRFKKSRKVGKKKVKRIGGKKRTIGKKVRISGINKRRKVSRKKKRFAAF